jgi:hypothetical protein
MSGYATLTRLRAYHFYSWHKAAKARLISTQISQAVGLFAPMGRSYGKPIGAKACGGSNEAAPARNEAGGGSNDPKNGS